MAVRPATCPRAASAGLRSPAAHLLVRPCGQRPDSAPGAQELWRAQCWGPRLWGRLLLPYAERESSCPQFGQDRSVTGPSRRDAWRAEPAVLLGWSEVRLLNVKVDVEAVACALSFSFDGDALPGGRQNVI